jgi:hypothetical protein
MRFQGLDQVEEYAAVGMRACHRFGFGKISLVRGAQAIRRRIE